MNQFSILAFLKKRPFSWSAMSSFEYSPDQWYESYILGIRQQSKEMDFGSLVDKRLQEDPTYLPQVHRHSILQHTMKAKLGKIPLIGVADSWEPSTPALDDFKTGKKLWDQKRADETGQLTFYSLLLYLTESIKPDDVDFGIQWLPTQETGDFKISLIDEKDVRTFRTKRTMLQMLDFCQRINGTVEEMEKFVHSKELA